MWKKIAAAFIVFTVLFTTVAPLMDDADARRYRSPSRSYTPEAPKQTTPQNRVDSGTTNRAGTVDSGTTNRAGTTNPAAGRTPSGFGGGGLMRGLMLGGLAGLLFGGMLAGMGAIGSFLGLLVNVLAIYVIFVLIRKVFQAFSNRNRPRGDYR